MKKVVVSANDSGSVISTSKNNPEFGYIRVTQTRMTVDDNGFADSVLMSALIHGPIDTLKEFGYEAGQEIKGKIIFKEQFKPFSKKDPERDLKIAGKSGIICTIEGRPIYRKNFYSDDDNANDSYIRHEETGEIRTHDNQDEIKAAYAALEETVAPEMESKTVEDLQLDEG